MAGENHWGHICNYQVADLTALKQAKQVRKTNNLEILFVLPYGKDLAQQWADTFAGQLQDIENWENPPDPAKLGICDGPYRENVEISGATLFYIAERGHFIPPSDIDEGARFCPVP